MLFMVLLTVIALVLSPETTQAVEETEETTSVQAGNNAEAQDRNEGSGVGCLFSGAPFMERMVGVRELFSGKKEIRELEDGYAFRFPGEGDWASRLMSFIESERQCCGFFTFEIVFEPRNGPIWLRLRGSQEVKNFIESMMDSN